MVSIRSPNSAGGLITPYESMSTGTVTPKQEDVEMSFSNMTEGAFGSFRSHDGLQRHPKLYQGEVAATQAKERNIRSDAPSIQTSRQPSHRHEGTHLAAMELKTPGGSLQIVGEKVNLLVNAIDELRQLGLKEIDTELPELVLVGDQSAGKSTLMGAIAEINLPKDKGMCTRCPANIKTSPADTWSCSVSLHDYYFYSRDSNKRPTKSQPFPPWKKRPEGLIIHKFKTISDKSELEDVLRFAQMALLNPSNDPKSFIPGAGVLAQRSLMSGQKHEADFSPNLVAIEIFGPRLPALSFYDLPGIFVSAASKEEEYLIKVFENLATEYIMRPNALVICAMTMQNDPGLSRTSAIINQLKAEKRCIGVLTMPDRLQEGSTHVDFDKILRGQAHVLPGGYYVTKQPGPGFQLRQADYHSQAREEEEAFFDSDPRWTGPWKPYRPNCGTVVIQNKLSQMLANRILESMDNIDDKVRSHTKEVDDALSALPELPNRNVQHVVRARLQQFSNGVQRLLEGGTSNGFLSSWSRLSIDFRDAIQSMRPMFAIHHPSDKDLPEREYIDLVNDSDDEPETPLPNRKRGNQSIDMPQAQRQKVVPTPGTPSNRDPATPRFHPAQHSMAGSTKQERTRSSSPNSNISQRRQIQPMKRATRKTVFDRYLGWGRNFASLDEIRNVINEHEKPGIPDHINDSAKTELCLLSVNPWNLPLETLSDHTFKMLREAVLEKLNCSLGDYKQTELYRVSKRHILGFLQMLEVEQRQTLQALYDLESYKMFTINSPAFEKYKAEELRILQDARKKRRVSCFVDNEAALKNKTLTDTTRATAEKAVTDEQLGPDPFNNEVQLAAYVRGYYKTAGLRFADNICQNIQGNLFKKVVDQILGLLEDLLTLNEGDGEAKCKSLMTEDSNEAKQRLDLQEKKAKFVRAAEKLAQLVKKYGEEGSATEGLDRNHRALLEDVDMIEEPRAHNEDHERDHGLYD